MEPGGEATEDESLEIEALRKKIQALGDDLQRVNGELHSLVHERPLMVFGAALAAGFLLGRVIRRA